MEEDYRGKKIEVKLTKEELVRISKGEIIEGYRTRIGIKVLE